MRYGLARILLLAVVLAVLQGCNRGQDSTFDDRTLDKLPVVDTVQPEDRRDPFRP